MDTGRPFDARLQLIRDRDSVAQSWSTVSLVTGIREYVLRDADGLFQPCSEHYQLLSTCADELTSRGLDAHSLVRYGMFPEILAGILSVIVNAHLNDGGTPEHEGGIGDSAGWIKLLEPHFQEHGITRAMIVEGQHRSLSSLLATAVPVLAPWVLHAPLHRLLAMTAPSSDELSAAADLATVDNELLDQYRWAVERFSVTALQDWSTEALHLELRWILGTTPPPCSASMMDDNVINKAALEAEIARRAVDPQVVAGDRRMRVTLASRMTRQAMAHMRDLRWEEAAALFTFAIEEDPEDAEALNNLGFCTLPIDPRRARTHLDRAAALGYRNPAINLHNRVIATYLLSGANAAINLAEDGWHSLPQDVGPAMLWDLDNTGDLALTEEVMPRDALQALASRLAHELGSDQLVEVWAQRAA